MTPPGVLAVLSLIYTHNVLYTDRVIKAAQLAGSEQKKQGKASQPDEQVSSNIVQNMKKHTGVFKPLETYTKHKTKSQRLSNCLATSEFKVSLGYESHQFPRQLRHDH